MDSNNSYSEVVRSHYQECWNNNLVLLKWDKGPIHELPKDFSVLCFSPTPSRKMWTYATCNMSTLADPEPIELHVFAPEKNDNIAELLTVIAHYHKNKACLSLWDTVNFGRPWWPNSLCDYGLISLPYLDGPTLEWQKINEDKIRFLWLIPITQEEVNYKKLYGVEALESKFEEISFNYLNPHRLSVI